MHFDNSNGVICVTLQTLNYFYQKQTKKRKQRDHFCPKDFVATFDCF